MAAPSEFRFCWWNVQDFAHFDVGRAGTKRWPKSADEYAEKLRRVVTAFDSMFGADQPDVIGLCEITRPAAERLRARRFPDHDLVLTSPGDLSAFQITLLIRRGRGLTGLEPWFAEVVPAGTRPMGVVRYQSSKANIRIVACHWPAFDEESSSEARRHCADRLQSGIYDFLFPSRTVAIPRHVVVFGDFNIEPYTPLFRRTVYSSRDRDYARRRPHHTDDAVRRVGLYNCGWRLLGEAHPHGQPQPSSRRVGTYYRAKNRQWRSYDQVLVTGGLLTGQPPYFDEGALLVRADTGNLVEDKPAKFRFENGVGYGVSDHYPLSGRIVLG